MGKKKLKLEINFQQTILKWDKKSSERTKIGIRKNTKGL